MQIAVVYLRKPVFVWWLDGLNVREGVCRKIKHYPGGRCYCAVTSRAERLEIFEDDVFFDAAAARRVIKDL